MHRIAADSDDNSCTLLIATTSKEVTMAYDAKMIASAVLTLAVVAYPLVRLANFAGDIVQKL